MEKVLGSVPWVAGRHTLISLGEGWISITELELTLTSKRVLLFNWKFEG